MTLQTRATTLTQHRFLEHKPSRYPQSPAKCRFQSFLSANFCISAPETDDHEFLAQVFRVCDLAADYCLTFTRWAEAFCPPTLTCVAGAGSDAPTTEVFGNVSLQSAVSPSRGNALGCALCCGRQD